MAVTYKNRQVQANQVAFDQIDIFQADFYTRVPGLSHSDVVLTLTLNNEPVSWPLVDGSAVQNSTISSGRVYWGVLPSGAYGVRFFPNSYGLWTLSIGYTGSPLQLTILSLDVVNFATGSDSGLSVGFCT